MEFVSSGSLNNKLRGFLSAQSNMSLDRSAVSAFRNLIDWVEG